MLRCKLKTMSDFSFFSFFLSRRLRSPGLDARRMAAAILIQLEVLLSECLRAYEYKAVNPPARLYLDTRTHRHLRVYNRNKNFQDGYC